MKPQVRERAEKTSLATKCKQIRQQWSGSESQRRRERAAVMQGQLALLLRLGRGQLVAAPAPVRV